MGTPSVDHVLRCFTLIPGDVHHVEDAGSVVAAAAEHAAVEAADSGVDAEKKPMEVIREKVGSANDDEVAFLYTTQQDLPIGDNYFTKSRHERLLATEFLLLKSNKAYVLTFKILAQVLVSLFFSKLAI
jgi:hypothetical protein